MNPKKVLASALGETFAKLKLPYPEKLVIEAPRNAEHGDLATNAALLLARFANKKPREIALEIAGRLSELCPRIDKVEVAGPGFCNITFHKDFWREVIPSIEKSGAGFGRSRAGNGLKVMVEYVSANPTGPLHVGHGRGAAVGDSVARLLDAAGYDVVTEYYLNDAGRQMRLLGASIWARLLELAKHPFKFPEDGYKGDYIIEIAAKLLAEKPDLPSIPEPEGMRICQEFGQNEILDDIKNVLNEFRCRIDGFFSESSLVENGSVAQSFQALEKSGRSYSADGALWFETTSLGDDQNRVLKKSDGSLTYFATDIAYHHNKFARGNQWLVDVWGADHHGYIPRMRAAIAAMGEDTEKFDVLLIQLVTLIRDGKVLAMSTRQGTFETLSDVIRDVGTDAARFMFLSRSCDSPLDFDLDLAKQRTMDNPVYYVQYAHARVCSLLRRAEEQGIVLDSQTSSAVLKKLETVEDMAILRQLAAFEELVTSAAKKLAPHHISHYLMELAAKLHSYYGKYTIISTDNVPLTQARLALLRATGTVLRNGLALLGVEAPETM